MAISKRRVRDTLLGKFQFREVGGSRHEAVALFHGEQKIG
jgi:hypothetical protein